MSESVGGQLGLGLFIACGCISPVAGRRGCSPMRYAKSVGSKMAENLFSWTTFDIIGCVRVEFGASGLLS